MKDKHSVIRILVSSSNFNSLFRRFIKILDFFRSSFFPGVPRSLNYITTEIHLNHYKASPCVVNFFFFLSSFCLPEFFMEALHSCSSRILFILQLFFKISLDVMIRQTILKINMVPNTCFVWGFQAFFILPSEVQFFYIIYWGGVMSFVTISFMFHDSHVFKNEAL